MPEGRGNGRMTAAGLGVALIGLALTPLAAQAADGNVTIHLPAGNTGGVVLQQGGGSPVVKAAPGALAGQDVPAAPTPEPALPATSPVTVIDVPKAAPVAAAPAVPASVAPPAAEPGALAPRSGPTPFSAVPATPAPEVGTPQARTAAPAAVEATPVPAPKAGGVGVDDVLAQGNFWRDKGRADLARQAYGKVLLFDPQNLDAIYNLGVIAANEEDTATANERLAQLSKIAPADPRVGRLEQAIKRGGISQDLIAQARDASQHGKIDIAIALYKRAFKDQPPPAQYAYEYYMTLAGNQDGGWQTARQAMQLLAQRNPDDPGMQVSYAQILTYREVGRRDAIQILSRYADTNPTAHEFWRNALKWMQATREDKPLFDAYLARYPDDKEIADILAKLMAPEVIDTALKAIGAGFVAFNGGDLAKADDLYQQALKFEPNNANALSGLAMVRWRQNRLEDAATYYQKAIDAYQGNAEEGLAAYSGLGYVRSAQGRYDDAAAAFQKAIDLSPKGNPKAQSGLATLRITRKLNDAASASGKNLDETLRLAREAAETPDISDEDRRAAQATLANVLVKAGKYGEAESLYRRLLAEEPGNRDVIAGLYITLLRERKLREARSLLGSIPGDLRRSTAGAFRPPAALDPQIALSKEAEQLRQRAQARVEAGDVKGARALFEQAMTRDPASPWVRLSYARLLLSQGEADKARALMQPVAPAGTTDDGRLFAAALFATEDKRPRDAQALLERIPPNKRTAGITTLQQQLQVRALVEQAQQAGRMANRAQAIATLRRMAAAPNAATVVRGEVALRLYELGDTDYALGIVQSELAKGVRGRVQDYAAIATVLVRAGRSDQADQLISQLWRLVGNNADDKVALRALEASLTARRVDQLREAGRLADAYDLAQSGLAASPRDVQLRMALARLYRTGKLYPQAHQVIDPLLAERPDDVDVVTEAVWLAIVEGDYDRGHELLDPVLATAPQTASLYYLAGQLDNAEGDRRGAIRNLETAHDLRLKELGIAQADNGTVAPAPAAVPPPVPAPAYPTNPFRSEAVPDAVPPTRTAAAGDTSALIDGKPAKPGIVRLPERLADDAAPPPLRTAASGDTAQPMLINSYGIRRTDENIPTYRPQAMPMVPAYGSPAPGAPAASLPAGAITPVSPAVPAPAPLVVADLEAMRADPLGRDIESNLAQLKQEVAPELLVTGGIRYRDGTRGTGRLLEFTNTDSVSFSPLDTGRVTLSVSPVSIDAGHMSRSTARNFGTNPTRGSPEVPGRQSDFGVALDAAYEIRSFRFDVGSTPLGFRLQNIQAGAAWQPQLSDTTRLKFEFDRRPVTDSVLSYAGTRDPVTGKSWGGVMRTGGNAAIYYDDGLWGAYGLASYHIYTGKRVQRNQAIEGDVGVYRQVYKDENNRVQLGLDFYAAHFRRNQNFYTLGHGGYFSPDRFFAVSFPITYRGDYGRWSFDGNLAVGYQNSKQAGADVFPGRSSLQNAIVSGNTRRYSSSHDNGIGVGVRGGVGYKISERSSLGASAGYTTFGDYNETTGLLSFKYNFGD